MFSVISAIGKNHEIGKGNDLIFHLKEDMKFFREKTTGHKIVMGRKTWESLPGKLTNRENIVISTRDFAGPDQIIHDVDQFISENKDTKEEIFIIGGGKIYAKFLPYTKTLYLTEVDASDSEADVFFPEFNRSEYEKTIIKEYPNFKITKYQKG